MSEPPFQLTVSDLLGHTGARRTEVLEGEIAVSLDQVSALGIARAEVVLEAVADGLVLRGAVEAPATLRCNRCLIELEFPARAELTQAFGPPSDDDILPIESDGSIDLGPLLHDELSLAIPLVPLCRESCLGLCPTCGTDLNRDPCEGHPEESTSPFAALEGLFETNDSPAD